jgi:hypothetical protein
MCAKGSGNSYRGEKVQRYAARHSDQDAEAVEELSTQTVSSYKTTARKVRGEIMKQRSNWVFSIAPRAMFAFAVGLGFAVLVSAQNQEMQERVAEIKAAAARNKQALAQYTWVEQVTISLKGEEKKQESFQVRLGPDGQPQKSLIGGPPPEDTSGRRLKRHIVEKKKEEYKEYAEQIKSLIQRYVPPDRDLLGQAYQQGNILMGPEAGAPGQYRLVISNYIKPGDKMTLIMDKMQKQLVGLSIATYLDDPKDAVNVEAQFDQIPEGPNHVSAQTINGVSKQLTIAIQNSNYQRL